MSKLKTSLRRPSNWNASIYYRTLVPFGSMASLGLTETFMDNGDRSTPVEMLAEANATSDILQDYQRVDEGWENMAAANKTRPSYTRADGTVGVPPILVMDTDDDLFNVKPMNPAFRELGWQVNGKPLKKGQYIGVEDKDGKKVPILKDGEEGFDVVRNREKVDQFRVNLRAADLITCSTPRVEQYVKRECPDASTIVIPNCVDFHDYPVVNLADNPEGQIHIFWQGSPTHYECFLPLKDAIGRIAAKYPNTYWTFWGAAFPWLAEVIPAERLVVPSWCEYPEYKLRLTTRRFDINLCPLHDDNFNCCRSAIKAYEAAAIWPPVMSVAQRTGAYADELTDGENALLFSTPEEFEAQLEKAILDKELRDRLAKNMRRWLVDNRDPLVWAKILYAKLEDLVNIRKSLLGPPKEIITDDLSNQQPDVRPGETAGSGIGGEAADPGVPG